MIKPNMGITNTTSSSRSLSDALFSGTKQRVLGILYGQPARSFYANELISLAASGSGAVQRELATLTNSGLITVRSVGNQKHYQANPDSPIFNEPCAIIQKRSEEHKSELQSLMRISNDVFCMKKQLINKLLHSKHITNLP